MKQSYVLFVMILTAGCAHPSNTASRNPAGQESDPAGMPDITGRPDYRLILSDGDSAVFDPNASLHKPSPAELAKEAAKKVIQRAFLDSAIPIFSNLTAARLEAKNTNILDILLTSARTFEVNLERGIRNYIKEQKLKFPPLTLKANLLAYKKDPRPSLAGARDDTDNYFYSEDKLSLYNTARSNVLGNNFWGVKYWNKVTRDIRSLITESARPGGSQDPAVLLGLQTTLNVHPTLGAVAILEALVGIKPLKEPYESITPYVHVYHTTVPQTGTELSCANIRILIPLNKSNRQDATLDIEFGQFSEYKYNNFKLKNHGDKDYAPRLEGRLEPGSTLNRPSVNSVSKALALDFVFKKMTFDLKTVEVTDVDVRTSAGLQIGGFRHTLGGIQHSFVDKQFEDTINLEIANAIKKAEEAGENKLEETSQGILNKEDIQASLGIIFGKTRTKENQRLRN